MDTFEKLIHLEEIPEVTSPIGFIATNTHICMCDTSKVLVQNIRIMDSISLPDGRPCRVINIFKGYEDVIFKLTLDNGKSISGTDSLMVMTQRGFCPLNRIRTNDCVQTITDGIIPVTKIEKLTYNSTVYNLGLERGLHEMICNDIHICDHINRI